MGKEHLLMLAVISMKVNFLMETWRGKELLDLAMGMSMKVNGRMIKVMG